MTLAAQHTCVCCGALLPASASLGLCPGCAFREALLLDSAESTPDGVLRRIGDYDLLEETGRGGMGVVYRARQRSLDRTVALKVLLGGYFAGDEGRRRFRAEAAAAARLNHPGIVAIHEAGEADGQPFYSMEFIRGETLAVMLRRGPLPFRKAAELTEKIAAALDCAHAQGVLHRDLKPSNVLIDESGAPHVTDFGLAKILHDVRPQDEGLTLTNQIVGSPAWMAPEQAAPHAAPLTAAVDVYAAGAVLYEMLTGRPPFHGETPQAVLEQVQYADPIPPRRLNGSIPADLETICLKCLEKEPRQRYSGATGLAEDLRRFISGEPVLARPPGTLGRMWRWARRHRAAAAVLCAVVAALTTVAAVMSVTSVRVSRAKTAAEERAEESRRHLVRSLVTSGNRFLDAEDTQRALPFLMEAHRMMEGEFAGRSANSVRIATAIRHSPRPVKMWRADGLVRSVRFSSDGKRIVCANGTPLVRVWSADPSDDSEVALNHVEPVHFAAFDPAGSRILTAGDTSVQLWDAEKHERIGSAIPHTGSVASMDQKHPPLFSADGAYFLTCSGSVLRRWSAADGSVQGTELDAGTRVTAHCFLPDAALVLAATDRSEVVLFDAASGIRRATVPLNEPARALSVDASGKRAAAICGKNRVTVFRPASPEVPPVEGLHDARGFAYQADFLPGDERLLSCSYDGTVRLWSATEARLLETIPHPGGVLQTAHSSNGRRAVSACWDGGVRLFSLLNCRPLCSPMMHTGPVSAADVSSGGDAVVSAGYDDTVRLWRLSFHARITARGSFEPDDWQPGRAAVQHAANGNLTVIDSTGNRRLSPPIKHGTAIEQVCLSIAAKRLAVLDRDGVTIWNTTDASEVSRIALKRKQGDKLLMSQDGSRLIHVPGSGRIQILQTGGESSAAEIKLIPPVHAVSLSPDGQWIAAADASMKVRVWSAISGSLHSGPFGQEDGVQSITWSPDSHRLAAASGPANNFGMLRRTLQIFDRENGEPLTPAMSHNDDIQAVAFSHDGRWIATGCEDMQARIFDAVTGRLCCPPMPHGGFVDALTFNHDATLLATSSGDARLHLWEVPGGQSGGHRITTPSAARQIFFSPDSRRLTGWYGPPDRGVFRTASLEVEPPSSMTMANYVTAVSGFRMNPAGDLEPVPADDLAALWKRLRPSAADDAE